MAFVYTDFGSFMYSPSLALDTEGSAHISYGAIFPPSGLGLKYATNESGAWVTETVDNTISYVGFTSSLALDSEGKAHISYYDNTNDLGTSSMPPIRVGLG